MVAPKAVDGVTNSRVMKRVDFPNPDLVRGDGREDFVLINLARI